MLRLNNNMMPKSSDNTAKKILIIEDEKILIDMYCDKFVRAGFKVIYATEIREGLKLLEKQDPDLILLDILLPKENGIIFLKKLKERKKKISVPIIAFSNYDNPKIKMEAKKLGVSDYLIKTNYTPGQVVKRIKKYIN